MKKTFWQELKHTLWIGAGGFIGMTIADWIGKNEFGWEHLMNRIISMLVVCILFAFIEYKLQK